MTENCKESIFSKAWHLSVKCSPDAEKATFSCVTLWLHLKLQICHNWWRLWGTSATLLPARTCSCSGNGSQILSSVTRTCWQATSHHWKKSIFLNHFFMLPFPVLVWDLQACPCPCPSCPSFLFQEHVSPKVWLQLCRHLPSHTTGKKNKTIQHHCHHPLYHQPFNPLTPRSD